MRIIRDSGLTRVQWCGKFQAKDLEKKPVRQRDREGNPKISLLCLFLVCTLRETGVLSWAPFPVFLQRLSIYQAPKIYPFPFALVLQHSTSHGHTGQLFFDRMSLQTHTCTRTEHKPRKHEPIVLGVGNWRQTCYPTSDPKLTVPSK